MTEIRRRFGRCLLRNTLYLSPVIAWMAGNEIAYALRGTVLGG